MCVASWKPEHLYTCYKPDIIQDVEQDDCLTDCRYLTHYLNSSSSDQGKFWWNSFLVGTSELQFMGRLFHQEAWPAYNAFTNCGLFAVTWVNRPTHWVHFTVISHTSFGQWHMCPEILFIISYKSSKSGMLVPEGEEANWLCTSHRTVSMGNLKNEKNTVHPPWYRFIIA